MQERCNSIANALELHFSCTNPSLWRHQATMSYSNHISAILLYIKWLGSQHCWCWWTGVVAAGISNYNTDLHLSHIQEFLIVKGLIGHQRENLGCIQHRLFTVSYMLHWIIFTEPTGNKWDSATVYIQKDKQIHSPVSMRISLFGEWYKYVLKKTGP